MDDHPISRIPDGQVTDRPQRTGAEPRRSLAEATAAMIGALAQEVSPGTRLGTRDEVRATCGVSVGTFHEALRLLQATDEIAVRPGPGGGIFAGDRSALSSLLRDLHREAPIEPNFEEAARVLTALAPLLIEDAAREIDALGEARLSAAVAALSAAGVAGLRDVVRASLEVFATVVSLSPPGVLTVIAGSLLRSQITALPEVGDAIDPQWRDLVDQHIAAVTRMSLAIIDGDVGAALTARRDPEFVALFVALGRGRRR